MAKNIKQIIITILIPAILIFIVTVILLNSHEEPTMGSDILQSTGTPIAQEIISGSYVLTLIADEGQAFLNGEAVSLSNPPFIQNDIFYFPLEDVVQILGGCYSIDGSTATVELFGNVTQYQLGDNSVQFNNETFVVSGYRYRFDITHDTINIDESFSPLLVNDAIFLPSNFKSADFPDNGLNVSREYPEAHMIILGGLSNECGIDKVHLEDTYASLSEEFRSQYNSVGIVDQVLNYTVEKYENSGLEIYVLHVKEADKDLELMDGKVCALRITGREYTTPRGLTIGDSAYRAFMLYGNEHLNDSFSYKVANGLVNSIIFYTRYFGSEL